MGRGMSGKRKSLLTWPGVDTLFFYRVGPSARGTAWWRYMSVLGS